MKWERIYEIFESYGIEVTEGSGVYIRDENGIEELNDENLNYLIDFTPHNEQFICIPKVSEDTCFSLIKRKRKFSEDYMKLSTIYMTKDPRFVVAS